MKIIYLFFTVLLMACCLVSCNSEDENIAKKSDDSIDVSLLNLPDEVIHYETEEEYMASIEQLKIYSDSVGHDYVTDIWETLRVGSEPEFGYSRIEYGDYVKISHGPWISAYGLIPNVTYLQRRATCYYKVKVNPNNGIHERNYTTLDVPMGYIPDMLVDNRWLVKGCKVGGYSNGYKELSTLLFHIGYDASGKSVNV